MKKVSADVVREALAREAAVRAEKRKKKSQDSGREAVAKRPCPGISIGAPAAAARSEAPAQRPADQSRIPAPGDRGKRSEDTPRATAERPLSRPPTPLQALGPPVPPAPAPPGTAAPSDAARPISTSTSAPGDSSTPHVRPSGRMSVTRRQEGDMHILQTKVGLHDSALRDATVAREIVKMVLLPEDVEDQKKQSVNDVLHSIWPHFVHLAHDISTLRGAVYRHSDVSANLQNQLRETNEKLAGSDRRVRQLVESEASLIEGLKRELEEKKKTEEANKALEEANKATAEANKTLLDALAAKEADLKELRGIAADMGAKMEQCQKIAELATGKARAAEGRAAAAEEDRARAITAAVNRAIEEYKGSEEFAKDAAAACLDLYKFGYSDCMAKVAQEFPAVDLKKVAMEGGEDEGDAPEGEAGREGEGQDASAPVNVDSPDSPDPPPAEKQAE